MASSLGPSLHSEPNTTTSDPLPQSRDADQHHHAPAKQPSTSPPSLHTAQPQYSASHHRSPSSTTMAAAPLPLRRSPSPSSSHRPSVRPLTPPTSNAQTPSMPPPSSSRPSSPATSSSVSHFQRAAPYSDRKMSVDQAEAVAQPSSPPDDDQTMKSPTIVLTDRRAKRASSGAHAAFEGAEYGRDSNVLTSSSSSKQMRLSRAQTGDAPLSGADFEDHASQRRSTERAAVLQDVQSSRNERSLRRRPSLSSHSSREDQRSRTPSPILGDAYPYAGASTRPGHTGAPMIGPSAADLQALLYDKSERPSRSSSNRPPGLPDSSEIAAIIAKVEDMGVKDEVGASLPAGSPSSSSKEVELVQIVKKLGQHALEQETYIQSMEESLHNTRVTAVSVVSSLTAQHAYELSQEKQLRDRLEVELDGVQASAKKLSSLLAKAQSRNEGKDRERAASVEEEMKWVASLPGGSAKKPSSAATAAANAAMSPRQPAGSGYSDPFAGEEAKKNGELAGLGISETPLLPQSEYTDVFDSPMSAMISERNKLVADKRHLKNRVRDAEAQLHRLENELKALRPLLLQGSAKALTASSTMPSVPATPSSSQRTPGRVRKDPGSARRRRHNVMGDAEAEHLLLAARRLNHARAQAEANMPPFSETSPLKPTTARFSVVGDHPSTPPGRLNVPPRTPGTANTITAKTPRSTGKSRVSLMDSVFANGGPALPGSPQSRSKPSFRSHERLNSATSGIDELLQAAQTVSTPRDQRVNSLVDNGSSEQLRALADSAEASDTYFPKMPPVGSKTTGPTHSGAAPGLAAAIALERPQMHDSPKRRRMSATAVDQERLAFLSSSPQARYLNSLRTTDGGVVNGAGSRRLRTRTEGSNHPASESRRTGRGGSGDHEGEGGGISALDLLADQATASQNPSSSSEPSNSDSEKKADSYPGHGENGRGKAAPDEDTRESYHISSGPKQVASSLMAARARVAGGGAPIAYAHSPHSDYSERGATGPLPRYSTGYPPPSPHGTSGSHHSQLSSPITSSHSGGPMLPPPPSEAFLLRGGSSSGHHATAYGGHTNLPHLNTSVGHHGHPHQPSYSHQYNQQMHGHMPMSPHSHSMPPHLNLQHSHHHPGTTANGSPLPPQVPMPNGYMSSASPSPISASTPHHAYGYHPQQQQQQQQPLHSPHSSSGHRPSLSLDSSKTPKPKGGNTSPDKRLPYVRWTSEEDAKLRQAIMQHGQRWEAVAKAVGTRSYHQCRQRALLMRRKGLDPVVAGAGGAGGGAGGGGGERGGSGSSAGGGRGGNGGDGGSATPDADGDEGDELGEGEGEGEGEDGEGDDGEEYGGGAEAGGAHDAEQHYAAHQQRHLQQSHQQQQQVDPRLH